MEKMITQFNVEYMSMTCLKQSNNFREQVKINFSGRLNTKTSREMKNRE